MEIKYPFLIIVVPLIVILLLFIIKIKKEKFKEGSKIANTSFIKNTDYFKSKMREYKIIKYFSYITFISMIILLSLLLSRPSKVERKNIKKYNRDIIICMDISTSVDELNMELVNNLKETVNKLSGDRVGVSNFNTSSVLLVPLTDDYNYVSNSLDLIHQSLELNNYNYSSINISDNYFYLRDYIRSGTLVGNEERGSSLIGDGLASCVYNFSSKEKNRVKLVIFSTDNDLAGTPLISLEDAAKISKKENVKVYGIGTKKMKDSDRENMEKAVLLTGGKFYDHSNFSVDKIVSDIEKNSTSLLESNNKTKRYDTPEIPFIIFLGFFICFIFISKKVI